MCAEQFLSSDLLQHRMEIRRARISASLHLPGKSEVTLGIVSGYRALPWQPPKPTVQ